MPRGEGVEKSLETGGLPPQPEQDECVCYQSRFSHIVFLAQLGTANYLLIKDVRMMSWRRKRGTAGKVGHLDSTKGMEQLVVLKVNNPWDAD